MEESAIRRSRSTVTAVLQTAAENIFIFAFLLLTVTEPGSYSDLTVFFFKSGHLKKFIHHYHYNLPLIN
jgi:hypothetical protein